MIIVFSGTGNSIFVARGLSAALGDEIVSLPVKDAQSLCPADGRVIWVFPVYSWGIPPVLADVIHDIEIVSGAGLQHFAVMTCGDDTGYTDRIWRRAMAARGWRGLDAWSVQMPNTYVFMKGFDVDTVEVAQGKVDAAAKRIESIASAINTRRPTDRVRSDVVRGWFPWTKTYVIRPWFVRREMSPRPFHCTDDCIGCRICAEHCPMHNIKMDSGRPAWGDDCAFCLRCYHICPRHAVAWGKASRGKGQSRILINLTYKTDDLVK